MYCPLMSFIDEMRELACSSDDDSDVQRQKSTYYKTVMNDLVEKYSAIFEDYIERRSMKGEMNGRINLKPIDFYNLDRPAAEVCQLLLDTLTDEDHLLHGFSVSFKNNRNFTVELDWSLD